MMTAIWTILFLAGIGFFSWQMYGRLGVLLNLRRDDDRDYSPKTWGTRTKNTIVYAFGQYKFFRDDQPAGVMHIVIFWGFITLSLQVITMFVRGWFPEFVIPGLGMHHLGGPYGLAKDLFQVGVMIGVGIALSRWLITKPQRLFGYLPAEKKLKEHSHWEAYVILCFIFTIMASGFLYDAGRMHVGMGTPENLLERQWQPITRWISSFFEGRMILAGMIATAAWWVHNLVILVFLNLLPRSKHFHIITAVANVFFGKVEPRYRVAKRDFTSETPLFGRSTPDQFTWKQALDMYSCTECGRCSSNCPATATGKPLAPRQFLVDLRDNVYANQTQLLKKTGTDGGATFDVFIGEGKAISDEVVWSCVQCRACEEACPVNIEYVDKMVDIRQHLVQEASRFPSELGRAFKGMETQSNPWGISSHERDGWTEGLTIPRIADNPNPEYLYYVGCGGSFDSNSRSATRSFCKILSTAGVSYAILAKDELCNGDSARRLGNEYLFQTMAEALVGLLNSHNVKKILVNCPHCFNTLSHEYPNFGGNYEVIHAAEFVKGLIKDGKVKPKAGFDKNVVYHDSCNYGRFNDIYEEPRDLISGAGGKLSEMDRNKGKGMCCGAGGGRMWLEEPADQRVNVLRTEQALEKNPEVIATSCPFCKIMISSGVNEKGLADKVGVMDVMEIVAQNL